MEEHLQVEDGKVGQSKEDLPVESGGGGSCHDSLSIVSVERGGPIAWCRGCPRPSCRAPQGSGDRRGESSIGVAKRRGQDARGQATGRRRGGEERAAAEPVRGGAE